MLHGNEVAASYERSECIISAQADASLILKVAFLYYEAKEKQTAECGLLFFIFSLSGLFRLDIMIAQLVALKQRLRSKLALWTAHCDGQIGCRNEHSECWFKPSRGS